MTESFETTLGDRTTVTGGASIPRTPLRLDVGDQVGRYVIVSRLGSGSMGMVYGAFDPKLGRRVALKLLHETGDRTRAHDRLLSEAQATARLAHPNVVSVHDVGEHEGRVFLAMEYVEGQTLRRFVADNRPHWREIVRMYIEAGRGLAAAHDKDLVHRDFKPDNVMVDGSGRVRVMDFGLAMPADDPSSASEGDLEAAVASRKRMAGTPAYMAPEQFEGGIIGPHTDQFAFCIALYEALHGERPFAGSSAAELARTVTVGERRPVPRSPAPASIGRALARGLSGRPPDRYPSMRELLADLQPTPVGQRALRWIIGGLVLTGAASAVGLRVAEARQERRCEDEAAVADAVWNDTRREETHEAILASKMTYAEPVARSVESSFDDLLGRWKQVRLDVCVERHVDESLSPTLASRAAECLESDLDAFDGVLERIAAGERSLVGRIAFSVASLEGPERCGSEAWLEHAPPPDGALEELAEGLARARVSRSLEDWADAEQRARELLVEAREAEAIEYVASAQLILCATHVHHGRYSQARASGVEALTLSLATGAFHTAYRAGWNLAINEASDGRDPDQARSWLRLSAALLRRAGVKESAHPWATHHAREAYVFLEARRYREARESLDLALALQQSALGENHPLTVELRGLYGRLDASQGRYEDALATYREVARAYEDQFGPGSTRVADVRANAARVLALQGKTSEAVAEHRDVVRLCEEVEGPDGDVTGRSLVALAGSLLEAGEEEEAERTFRRAVAIFETHRPDNDLGLATARVQLGITLYRKGLYADARKLLEPAVAHLRRARGEQDIDVARVMVALGYIALGEGNEAQARAILRRASPAAAVAHRTDPALGTRLELALGALAERLDEPGEALTHYEAAASLIVDRETGYDLASAQWGIARMLQSLQREPERAQLAKNAALRALEGDDGAPALALRETIAAENASSETRSPELSER